MTHAESVADMMLAQSAEEYEKIASRFTNVDLFDKFHKNWFDIFINGPEYYYNIQTTYKRDVYNIRSNIELLSSIPKTKQAYRTDTNYIVKKTISRAELIAFLADLPDIAPLIEKE